MDCTAALGREKTLASTWMNAIARCLTRGGWRWFAGVVLWVLPSVAGAAVLYVDKNNPNCSNSGGGSQAVPFCTIGAAANQVMAGDTVSVKAGTYSERVVINKAGSSGSPIVFVADPGVTVSGKANGFDLSGSSWVTVQGFTVAQTTSHGIKAVLTSNLTLADNLIVDADGRGMYIKDSSNVTIENNEIHDSLEYGLYLLFVTGSTIAGNEVTGSGQPFEGSTRKGIYVNGSSNLLIEGNTSTFNSDSGIYLTSGNSGVHVKSNILHDNARVYIRAANGIDLRQSTDNTIEGNIAYDNEDSGIQIWAGSANNLGVNNLSYNNGDHGLDTNNASGTRWIGNTVYGNVTSGINVEDASTGSTVMNNVAGDNGVNPGYAKRGNINFDDGSVAGTVADYNLVYLSAPGTIYTWNDIEYQTLDDLRAAVPGLEINGIEADPQWGAPQDGDFQLSVSSPAVDSANSGASGALAVDLDGQARFDEPTAANTGAGPRNYDDRGAFEFQGVPPGNSPPVITSVPTATPNPVSADETAALSVGATDPDGDTLAYAWSVPADGGSIEGTGPDVTYVPPAVIAPQTYTVSVEVTDGFGGLAMGSVDVTVEPGPTLMLSPVADSYVEERFPNATHGSENILLIDGHYPATAYLRFDLTGLTGVVQSAVIELEVTNASVAGGTIHSVSDNMWDENTLNFNNSPVIDGPALDTLGAVARKDIVQMDVTAAINGGGLYSFAIVSGNPDGIQYRSREAGTATPVLIVNVAGGPS